MKDNYRKDTSTPRMLASAPGEIEREEEENRVKSLSDDQILHVVKKDVNLRIRVLGVLDKERKEREKELSRTEARRYDDKMVEEFEGAVVESVEIEEYSGGEWSDYRPTVMKVITDKGVYRVNDLREVN